MQRTLSVTNKFVISDNDLVKNTNEITSRVDKLTGQDIYIKYIDQYQSSETPTLHLLTLIDHTHYLKLNNVIHLHLLTGSLAIYVKKNGLLNHYSQHEANEEADFLYFTNAVIKELSNDILDFFEWRISGEVTEDSIALNELRRYFPGFKLIQLEEHILNTQLD